ncbi:hypothetical protein QJS10_CPB04g00050 [Acorus calamus]|uniref:Uncharacterized protein n=1 Tax=Acorus calamus TaxID=4465 RepID=A0AAV9F357_ACOCL|nr:hypothetical protein QJS10_CPB04g00050 [Acorus calamus]
MPRHNRSVSGLLGEPCKVRKRGCSSTSSSSSVLQNYKLKRAILVGRKGGSSTPVPVWKMSVSSPPPAAATELKLDCSLNHMLLKPNKAKHAPVVSARKLAATLWEMNEAVSPCMEESVRGRRGKRSSKAIHLNPLPRRLSDPSHSPASKDRSGSGTLRRRMQVFSERQRLKSKDNRSRGLDSLSNGRFMETMMRYQEVTPTGSLLGTKSRRHLKDLDGLVTSKELRKILNRIWGLEEQPLSSASIVSSLRTELEQSRVQVNQLIDEQKSYQNEISYLMRRFTEEKAAWRANEEDKFRIAVQSVMEELEVEKKLRRKAERVNKKLGLELSEAKASFLKANEELKSERRSREMIERVCDDLVRGMGEEKAEVDEMKRESAKAREEMEKEREMLQLADVWREERIQMKLLEAKFQFEEKNAAVDQLRNELEVFLQSNRSGEIGPKAGQRDDDEEENDDDDDSDETDLQSIELSMDNNKRYNWSYTNRASSEEEKKGKTSVHAGLSDMLDQDVERYKLVKGLRDHVLSGSRIGFARDPDMASVTTDASSKSRLGREKTLVTTSRT